MEVDLEGRCKATFVMLKCYRTKWRCSACLKAWPNYKRGWLLILFPTFLLDTSVYMSRFKPNDTLWEDRGQPNTLLEKRTAENKFSEWTFLSLLTHYVMWDLVTHVRSNWPVNMTLQIHKLPAFQQKGKSWDVSEEWRVYF